MSIKYNYNGATILQPGAYSKSSVNVIGGFPLSDTGIVGIIGEAIAGPPGDTTGIGVQTFTCEQMSSLIETYVSGPIVDVARALVQPARDNRVTNGAQLIRIWKTNSSLAGNNTISNIDTVQDTLYDIDSQNYGDAENLINFYISSGSSPDAAAVVLSDSNITFPLTVTSNDTLLIDVNGTTYTLTVTTASGGSIDVTQAQLITLLNGVAVTVGADTATPVWAPSKPVIAAASGLLKVTLTIDPSILTAFNQIHEYGLLSIDTSNIATLLNLTVASTISATTLVVTAGGIGPVRGSRGTRIITINRNDYTETLDENTGLEIFKIYYTGAGTVATMDVKMVSGKKRLQTTCTGATADDLNLALEDYTVTELVAFINNIGGGGKYTCVTSYYNAPARSAADIDWYDDIDILTLPVGIKANMIDIESNVNEQSQLVTLDLKEDVYGQMELVTVTNKTYLTGAALGATSNTDFLDGFDALLNTRCNTVLPCISRDATADITAGLTDPSSTYDIDSVIAGADTHCRTASNTKNRSERNCYVGYLNTFEASRIAARGMNSEFTSMAIQNVDVIGTDGTTATRQPHVLAALCAGIQAGLPIGEDITFKYINGYGLSHATYDAIQDVDTAINDGLLVVKEPDSGGYRIVVGNTTYGRDANFVFNRIAVLATSHYIVYNLRNQLEAIFIGTARQSASTTAKSVYNMAASILNNFRDQGLLVPDANNGYTGYKDLIVRLDGAAIYLDVKITPVQAIGFVFINLTLDNIRDVA